MLDENVFDFAVFIRLIILFCFYPCCRMLHRTVCGEIGNGYLTDTFSELSGQTPYHSYGILHSVLHLTDTRTAHCEIGDGALTDTFSKITV